MTKAVLAHRERQARRGIVRLEIQASVGDAGMIKALGATLRAGGQQAEQLREVVQKALQPERGVGLLELLACELDDVLVEEALDRPRDTGRSVEL